MPSCRAASASQRKEGSDEVSKSVGIIGTRGYPSYYGGFETAVRHLAPYLVDQGWHVRVYSRPGRVRPDDADVDSRIESIVTPGIDGRSLSTLTFGLTSVLHALAHKPDVALIMNCANGFWLPLLRLRGIPVVTNVDGLEWERAKWGRLARAVFKAGAKFSAIFSDDLIFDARAIAAYWETQFRRQGRFIPYGGTPAPLLPLQDALPSGAYVLLVARFVPENTVAEFLDAAPQIARTTDVVLVGSTGSGGELDVRARELANTNERIHWLGHISDDERLFALWQHAAVYFHGHSVGGTNPALVQAMSLGANVVARDTVYNREVLGDAGRYCAPQPEKIVMAIFDALERDSLGDVAKCRAATEYSWAAVCSDYHIALESLARQTRKQTKASKETYRVTDHY